MEHARVDEKRADANLPRALKLAAVLVLAVLVVASSVLVATAWRGLQRSEPFHAQLALLQRLQSTALGVEEALVARLSGRSIANVDDLDLLRSRVMEMAENGGFLDPGTAARLANAAETIDRLDTANADAIVALVEEFRVALEQEARAQQSMADGLQASTALEFRIAIGLLVALPVVALLVLVTLRNRILNPLADLRRLMSMLGQREYRTVPVQGIMPPLLPVFENYNAMVERLSELESHHRARQRSLEREVREVTGALLRQERELANAERLAAVGEIAASVAHELRNPLAGIQAALSGLRSDLDHREDLERVDLVLAELRRTTRLLNDLLDQARPASEGAVDLDIANTIGELLALVRFQLPERIQLGQRVPRELHWVAPDGRLRQALLNLILNSARAIGDQEGSIMVDAEVVDGLLLLRVTDDGPGFPEELLKDGVHSFVTWRKDGTGLGLATVQRFIRESEGRLQLQNRHPRGAAATIKLPMGGLNG